METIVGGYIGTTIIGIHPPHSLLSARQRSSEPLKKDMSASYHGLMTRIEMLHGRPCDSGHDSS